MHNKWIYIQKLINRDGLIASGFGDIIKITNNNRIVVSDYSNLIYIYDLNDNNGKFFLSETIVNNTQRLPNVYKQFSITNDDYDNIIIISNFENNLLIKNVNDSSLILFKHEIDNECFYGSYIFLYDKMLFVSCSLYYPFTNIPDTINPKIYIYDITYNLNNIVSLNLNQIINSPSNDIYFGTYIDANNKALLISGTSHVYYYEQQQKWNFIKNYTMSETYINYDYKLKLLDNNFIVTNYGYDYLRGAIFIEKYSDINSEIQDIASNSIYSNNMYIKLYAILFLILAGAVLTILITLMCYVIVQLLTPVIEDKKDKKMEEDISPYKVYSYSGYVETEDPLYYSQPPINNPQIYYFNPFPLIYYPESTAQINNDYQTRSILSPIEKGMKPDKDLKSDTKDLKSDTKADTKAEKFSKETVVTYKTSTYDSIIKTYEDKIKPHLNR